MVIVSIGSYAWAVEAIEDAQEIINLMSKSVPVELDFNIDARYRQKGGNDYIPNIEATLRAGEVVPYADAMAELEAKKKIDPVL